MEKQARTTEGPASDGRDWGSLSTDTTLIIADNLLSNDVSDLLRFRAVCTGWRKCTPDPRANGCFMDRQFLPRQWIMSGKPMDDNSHRLLNTTTGQQVKVEFPELADHDLTEPAAVTLDGLLVLRDNRSLVIRLLNPLTRQLIDLPSVTTLRRGRRRGRPSKEFTEKYKVTAAGFGDNSTVVVYFNEARTLAVARPGDRRWKVVEGRESLVSTISYKGRFYGISHTTLMMVADADSRTPRLVPIVDLFMRLSEMWDTAHMVVDSYGDLLLLCSRMHPRHWGAWQRRFEIFVVFLDNGLLIPMNSLEDHAAFVGLSGMLMLSTDNFPSLMENHVHFRFRYQAYFAAYSVLDQRGALFFPVEDSTIDFIASYIGA